MDILLLIITHLLAVLIGYFISNYFCKKGVKFKVDSLALNSSALISDEKTVELLGNYDENLETTRQKLNLDEKFLDAKLAWVSFSDMRNYMRYIEFLSIKNGFLNVKNMGLRMYYGTYPLDLDALQYYKNPLGTVSDDFVGRHTLVIVPTYNNAGVNTDFNPHYIDEKGNPMDLKNKVAKLKEKRRIRKNQDNKKKQEILLSVPPPNTIEDPNNPNTDINLNSFGLTPPKAGDTPGISFSTP